MSDTPLVRVFLSALMKTACQGVTTAADLDRADPGALEGLELQLKLALEQSRARWPAVVMGEERYLNHVATQAVRVAGSAVLEQVLGVLAKMNLVDLYLACACAEGQTAALRSFDQELLSRVPVFVARLRMSPAQVEEVVLQLRERLLVAAPGGVTRLAGFTGQGSLLSFVRISALRLALNLRRDREEQYEKRDLADIEVDALAAAAVQDPDVDYLRRAYREQFQAALRAAFANIPDEQRNLLYLYYVDGLNTRQIARLFQVNSTTASRRLVAARERIGDEVRGALRARLQVSDEELQSLYRAVRSYLEVSLRSVLVAGEGPRRG